MIARRCKIPLKEKIDIINQCDNTSRDLVAQQHLITKKAVDYIIRNSEKFKAYHALNPKKVSKGVRTTFPLDELESEVDEFVLKLNKNGITVNGEEIRCFAAKVAINKNIMDFKASKGWLQNFCERRGIKSFKMNGQEGLVDREVTDQWFDFIKTELCKYPDYLLLNADETSFEFQNQSNHGYVHPDGDTLNIVLSFLPPNTTSVTQPLDSGIIRVWMYQNYFDSGNRNDSQ